MQKSNAELIWNFYRLGGIDQVKLDRTEELLHLRELDPKLWVCLSCPSKGLELDDRTLQLLDSDRDGRIRLPEVLEAVEWICRRLKNPADMVDPPAVFPLSAINDENEDGRRLRLAAEEVLSSSGKSEAEAIKIEEVSEALAAASGKMFNGDGILPPLPELEADVRHFIQDALDTIGGREDASGKPGIDRQLSEAFINRLNNWLDWRAKVGGAESPLGQNASEAWELVRQLKPKVDDYFLRSELASFAPALSASMNFEDHLKPAFEEAVLTRETLADLPLSHVEANRPLRLSSGLNPAWRKPVERLFSLTEALRPDKDEMTRNQWAEIQEGLAGYSAALEEKPKDEALEVAFPPSKQLDELGAERIEEIVKSKAGDRFAELAAKDAQSPASSKSLAELEKLLRYYHHLHRFLLNFVSFYDFYTGRRPAAFQAGYLYLDGRCCRLCVPVDDVEKHALLAGHSKICLVYCQCQRRKKSGENEPDEIMTIVAAMTAGDADYLLEGRNGVFIDNDKRDWDAKILKIVPNIISLRQAVWEPYKKVAKLVGDQAEKLSSTKKDQFIGKVGDKIAASTPAPAPDKAPASGFDIGKSVGIFAAIGLALGAIGTALASLASAFFSLSWWQIPLVFVGLFLLISGPSVILGWLKLRKRTLGPLLEASGWAVNSRAPINITLANRLTDMAALPENANRSHQDPLKEASRKPRALLLLLVIILGVALWFFTGLKNQEGAEELKTPAQPSVEISSPTVDLSGKPGKPDAE